MTASGGQLHITRPAGLGGSVTCSHGSACPSLTIKRGTRPFGLLEQFATIPLRRPRPGAVEVAGEPGRSGQGMAGIEIDTRDVSQAPRNGKRITLVTGAPPLLGAYGERGWKEPIQQNRPIRIGSTYRVHLVPHKRFRKPPRVFHPERVNCFMFNLPRQERPAMAVALDHGTDELDRLRQQLRMGPRLDQPSLRERRAKQAGRDEHLRIPEALDGAHADDHSFARGLDRGDMLVEFSEPQPSLRGFDAVPVRAQPDDIKRQGQQLLQSAGRAQAERLRLQRPEAEAQQRLVPPRHLDLLPTIGRGAGSPGQLELGQERQFHALAPARRHPTWHPASAVTWSAT